MDDEKHTSIDIGNNNNDLTVIINENEAELYKKVLELSCTLTRAEKELMIKDKIIKELIKRLKR